MLGLKVRDSLSVCVQNVCKHCKYVIALSYTYLTRVKKELVQSFYEEKGVNLKQIATQMIPTVSSTEKCAL